MSCQYTHEAIVKLKNSPLTLTPPPRVNLVVLSHDEQYVLRMTERLNGSGLFHIEHVESLSRLRLREQPIDIVMAEIHADHVDSLMLPCWVGELNAYGRVRRAPHIVWTIKASALDDATSSAAAIEQGRTDIVKGISSIALASYARLARASGIRVEIVAENHPTQLLQVLEKLATAEHLLPQLSQSDRFELLISEDDVVSVITSGENLRVVLQPQYNLASRQVIGAEALIRWQHPIHGDIPPLILIPMVEQLGLGLLLFSHVERAVIEVLGTLDRLGIDIPIAINASARTLCATGLATRLAIKMHKAGLPARRLKIELTEQITPGNELVLSASIMALRAKGFLISLGDFGAGAATLALLTHIPFDEMKIDGKLAGIAEQSPQSSEIISGIVNLARYFNLNLVTEGIEDPSSIEMLNRLGCSAGQGLALAPPLEQADFLRLVAR